MIFFPRYPGWLLGILDCHHGNFGHYFSRCCFQTFFIFTPTWGNDPIWLIFFQKGWNHQLFFFEFRSWQAGQFLALTTECEVSRWDHDQPYCGVGSWNLQRNYTTWKGSIARLPLPCNVVVYHGPVLLQIATRHLGVARAMPSIRTHNRLITFAVGIWNLIGIQDTFWPKTDLFRKIQVIFLSIKAGFLNCWCVEFIRKWSRFGSYRMVRN